MYKKKYINFSLPYIGKDEINEIVNTLKSGWLTAGPKTNLFENNFKQYVRAKHAIAISSCTAGLHLALLAVGIKNGDEVITTPYTFASTILSIIEVGAKPIFVDIREDTLNLNEKHIEEKITKKTKAILPVHFGGVPCEMDTILKLSSKYNLSIIEDAAHALGSEYQGIKIGNLGDITAFSFYATKNLTTGEGGMVTTNNDQYAQKIRTLSLHGISRDSYKRYSRGGNWYYEVLEKGYKYNFTDIQASIGIHQLKKLEKMNARRTDIAGQYYSYFKDVDELIFSPLPNNIKNSWHLYCIHLNLKNIKGDRNDIIEQLKRRNIGTSVHFIPINYHPYFKRTLDIGESSFPIATKIFNRIISLPIYPSLKDKDVKYIANSVLDIIEKNRK